MTADSRHGPALRFGLMYLQAAPFDDLLERVRRGEDMGFDSLWVADHMTGQYPDLVSYEAWSLLGAIAMATSRARIGTLVTPITFRHPALLAMAATTVDHVSGGRLEIGLGIGGGPIDRAIVGADECPVPSAWTASRSRSACWTGCCVASASTHTPGTTDRDGAVIERPLQQPRPPLVIAGDGPRLLDLVARTGDAWNTLGGQPMRGGGAPAVSLDLALEATRARTAVLDEACDRIGRDRSSLRRSLLAYRVSPDLFRSADAFTDYVGRYREAGVHEFVFYWPVDPGTFRRVPAYERALERIASETIPALRASSTR